MSLGLSALDALDAVPPVGTAPRAPLSMFYEDPDQPRKEFDAIFLQGLAAEIKAAGTIHTAINVRPPAADGRMRIIHGAQRYRASVMAGVPDIPYLVQTDARVFDAYSQVSENQQRRSLTPRELALFINERMAQGDSQSFIAARLQMEKSEITFHLTLVNGPAYVIALYDQRKCLSPRILYELARLAKTHPDQVQQFCRTSEDFGGAAIHALKDRLQQRSVCTANAGAPLAAQPPVGNGSESGLQVAVEMGQADASASGGQPAPALADEASINQRAAGERSKRAVRTDIRKPMILASDGIRRLKVMLHKRPSRDGWIHVKYLDDQSEAELCFDSLAQQTLVDAAK